MSAAVAADLRAVRDRLVTHGWTQRFTKTVTGKCCLVGATVEVGLRGDAWLGFRSALFPLIGTFDIADWNDAPGRTFAGVLALLDKAIAAEEARP